uniref:Uncharacterized protein n=1 Tax=Desertifilum tharense IPPAS B-1220 TaxID=1781255 RepID=A0A1E5QD53_9CYAN|nr:hypothetical protein BH720_24055 [Desertifilum tharense IPPAS B-1220]
MFGNSQASTLPALKILKIPQILQFQRGMFAFLSLKSSIKYSSLKSFASGALAVNIYRFYPKIT